MTEFEGIVPALSKALDKRGYTVLTPVQKAVLEGGLVERDLLVSAQTGSGKTVAFGLAIAPALLGDSDRFARTNAPLALAIAPTRELALQVKRELEWLYEETGAQFASCVGGMDMRTERRALSRGAHIVVGTPGRLRDHIERGSLDMSMMKAVVLDEADEMLDMGFRDDLEYILGAAPDERRTLMFSATVPRMIATLAKRYQRDAVRLSTKGDEKQHLDIDYQALAVAPNDRENAIVNVLRYHEAKNAIIFCSTRATVNHMTSRFSNRGFSVVALSGELSQNERTHALQAMRDGRARVCVATDVAARGIDLPNLELVIHADIPKSAESLVHRSGRTGRAGRKGVCTLIVPYNQRRRTESLLKRARIEAKWIKPPSAQDIVRRDDERLLADPSLSEPASEQEQAFAGKLLAEHGAEQIAAAFVRLFRKEQTAPEELLDQAPVERGRGEGRRERRGERNGERSAKPRENFSDGVWFSLSIGRKQNAEPRWILPMLCRGGGITKRDIGAIRIDHTQTNVELAPKCIDRFLETLGPDKTLEKNIIVKRLDGPPKPQSGAPEKRDRKKKSYADKRPFDRSRPKKGAPKRRGSHEDRPEKKQKGPEAKPSPSPSPSPKPAEPVKSDAKAKPEPKANWNPLDSSARKPGGKAGARGRAKPAGGSKGSKSAKHKPASRKPKSGDSRSKLSLAPGMAPRKRKKPKNRSSKS